ncbi:hypothetical protein [Halosimplex salinum]|uniref:hypothetical protein n=1 Tax=Halosimplex salinum TaxID=1710538 RepID=UPI000F49AAE5|nr:hypothetical protein [Halosimplex salinum]
MSWLARWFDRVRGRGGRAWAGSAEDLLFDGESVEQRVDLEDGNRVVVTSHRLLAFTPESGGENYRDVDLPNVADVRAGHEGERNLLWQGGRTFLYGAILLAVGVFLDFESFVPTDVFSSSEATGRLGIGGVLGLLQRFLGLVARLDEFARLIGALLVLFAVFVFGVYLLTRDSVLVVDVAGDDEAIRVPASDATLDGAVADLQAALFGTGATVESESGDLADAGVSETPGEAGDPVASPSDAETGDSDPLAADSGAVRSGGIVDGREPTASERDGVGPANEEVNEEEVLEDVERAVRETSRTDFSETVDEVVEGPDESGAEEGDPDRGTGGFEFGR